MKDANSEAGLRQQAIDFAYSDRKYSRLRISAFLLYFSNSPPQQRKPPSLLFFPSRRVICKQNPVGHAARTARLNGIGGHLSQ